MNSSFWRNQLRQWHWISSAVTLVGVLLFSITGFTLNHADLIKSKPKVTHWEKPLSPELTHLLEQPNLKITPEISEKITKETGVETKTYTPEIEDGQVYYAMPGPGFDQTLTLDSDAGTATYEKSHRGVIAVLNDLHKGRDSGAVWKAFIDVIAIAAVIFSLTGFGLLWLYAKGRRITWSLVGLGVIVPIILFLLFVHT